MGKHSYFLFCLVNRELHIYSYIYTAFTPTNDIKCRAEYRQITPHKNLTGLK